jgi:hypothetical protein
LVAAQFGNFDVQTVLVDHLAVSGQTGPFNQDRPGLWRRAVSRELRSLAWLRALPVITAPIVGAAKLQRFDDAPANVRVKLTGQEITFLEEPYIPHAVVGFS